MAMNVNTSIGPSIADAAFRAPRQSRQARLEPSSASKPAVSASPAAGIIQALGDSGEVIANGKKYQLDAPPGTYLNILV